MSEFLSGLGFGILFLTVAWWLRTHVHFVTRGAPSQRQAFIAYHVLPPILVVIALLLIGLGIASLVSQ